MDDSLTDSYLDFEDDYSPDPDAVVYGWFGVGILGACASLFTIPLSPLNDDVLWVFCNFMAFGVLFVVSYLLGEKRQAQKKPYYKERHFLIDLYRQFDGYQTDTARTLSERVKKLIMEIDRRRDEASEQKREAHEQGLLEQIDLDDIQSELNRICSELKAGRETG